MKKTVSILIAILIMLCPASVFAQAFTANEKNIPQFTSSVKEILSSYNNIPIGKISSEMYRQFGDGIKTGRLIVKSSRRISSDTAVMKATGFEGYTVFQYSSAQEAIEAYLVLSSLKYVESIEFDDIVTVNDPVNEQAPDEPMLLDESDDAEERSYLSWGAERLGFSALNNYIKENNIALSPVKVGYIDTGIDDTLEIFENRVIQSNYNTSDTGDENSSFDDYGHGTNGASLLADLTDDNVKIVSYKCLNSTGAGSLLGISACILKATEDDVDIINLSLGSIIKSVLGDAIIAAEKKGIVVSVASGNFSYDMDKKPFYPGSINSVLCVSCIDESEKLSYFSNYGSCVDITAPGENLAAYNPGGELTYVDGTSFAAPHVSAACAMILGMYPEANSNTVEKLLKDNAIRIPDDKNGASFGSGLVNVAFLTSEIDISQLAIADYSEVFALVDIIDDQYSVETLALYYTNKSAKVLLEAKHNVVYNLTEDQQETVDSYAEQLNDALNGLQKANSILVIFRKIFSSITDFKTAYWIELY